MPKKKKAKGAKASNGNGNGNGKARRAKLQAKFLKRIGEVRVKGCEVEETPKSLEQVMHQYGFDFDPDHSPATWVDVAGPVGDNFIDEFGHVAAIAPISINTTPKRSKAGKVTINYEAAIGEVKAKGNDVYDALVKAFDKWNKAGRPINQVPLQKALDGVVQTLNG